MRSVALALVLGLCVACGEQDQTAAAPSPSPAVPTDPRELAGQWRVSGETVEPGTEVLFVDNGSMDTGLALYLSCGRMTGAWEADAAQQLFVGQVSGGPSGCFEPGRGPVPVPWLDDAARFRSDGADILLADREGEVVARLHRRGSAEAPGRDPDASAVLEAAPLPSGATAATRDQLLRRWVPADGTGGDAYLEMRADGSFRGSDGCNGQGGRFVLGQEGRLVTVEGPSTLALCPGAPVGWWVQQAARAAVSDRDELSLYDTEGALVARLVPEDAEKPEPGD